jgi:hypothetical protein
MLLFSTAFLFGRTAQLNGRILAEMRETGKISLDAALRLRRAGDLEGMTLQSKNLETACAKVVGAYPDLAEPHYLLARLYRAQIRYRRRRRSWIRRCAATPGTRLAPGARAPRWISYRVERRERRNGGIPRCPATRTRLRSRRFPRPPT